MAAKDDRPGGLQPRQDYRSLPSDVRLEETIAIVERNPVPEPEAGRTSTSIAPYETTD